MSILSNGIESVIYLVCLVIGKVLHAASACRCLFTSKVASSPLDFRPIRGRDDPWKLKGVILAGGLAEIQARAGEPGEAVKTPRRLLSLPIGFYISIQQLMIDLVWDSIRHDRGFQQLLAGKEKIGQTSK